MIRPLPGYCLIQPSDQEETTVSGLVLPDKVKEKPAKGKVIAVGGSIPIIEARVMGNLAVDKDHGFLFQESHVKVDDIVIFNRWSATTIKDGDKEVLLVRFTDLQGIYEDK